MGMAASQARYLALTARKTNTEYEGQQINQARTALANQSANLFNRLLSMEVPNPPKTTDYTKVQYSYSDGDNASVLESWQQLSSADPNYNYIVTHYYYADIYTGGQKLLQNPEVTLKGNVEPATITTPTVTYTTDSKGNNIIEISGEGGTKTVYTQIRGLQKDKKYENALEDFETYKQEMIKPGGLDENDIYAMQDKNGTWHFIMASEIGPDETDPTQMAVKDYATTYKPGYVGNCELTELTNPLTKEEKAELAQIIRDLPDTNMKDYLSINPYAEDPDDKLVYTGNGVYAFQMNGQTYFACEKDLYNSMQTYDKYGKPIENQAKLPYYNASYINTKIEQTNHALLETDGNGRFKSVKFDDDSIVYSLNTETITDEAAYEDAMNQYLYKKDKYEKTIADINAKTSIIQKEDRTLELRLKQLDTEQLALKTEMEAVQKVIKDNVEKTFKTFGD